MSRTNVEDKNNTNIDYQWTREIQVKLRNGSSFNINRYLFDYFVSHHYRFSDLAKNGRLNKDCNENTTLQLTIFALLKFYYLRALRAAAVAITFICAGANF